MVADTKFKARTFRTPLIGKVKVDRNRVEITKGVFPLARKQVVPLRNISNVRVTVLSSSLVIETNDGDDIKLRVLRPFAIRSAIAEAM